VLNIDEKEELKHYKSRLEAFSIGFLLSFVLSVFIIAVMDNILTSVMFKIVVVYYFLYIVLELYLAPKDYKVYSRILGFFFFWLSMSFFIFIGSFYAVNIYIIKWQFMPNFVMYSLAVFLFFVSLSYNLRNRDFINEAVKEGKLNLEEKIYYVFQKGHSEVIKQSARLTGRMGLLAAVTPAIGVSIIFMLGFEVNAVDTKQIIRGVGMLIGLYPMLVWTAPELAKAIQFYQYEKKNGEPIYTNLIKYIKLEDEINLWRKGKRLGPVKIKSPFFFGDIEK